MRLQPSTGKMLPDSGLENWTLSEAIFNRNPSKVSSQSTTKDCRKLHVLHIFLVSAMLVSQKPHPSLLPLPTLPPPMHTPPSPQKQCCWWPQMNASCWRGDNLCVIRCASQRCFAGGKGGRASTLFSWGGGEAALMPGDVHLQALEETAIWC